MKMNVLLISNSSENIDIAQRHFRYEEYVSDTAVGNEAAMEKLTSEDAPKMAVYYCGKDTDTFYPFYHTLRNKPETAEMPLLVFADANWHKVLTGYVKFYNTRVLGIMVNDEKLKEIVGLGIKYGFEVDEEIIKEQDEALSEAPPVQQA